VALAVGRRILEGRGTSTELRPPHSPWAHLLVGFFVIHSFCILAFFFGASPLSVGPLAILLTVLGVFVMIFATTLGYGAVLLTRLGKQGPVGAGGPSGGQPGAPFTPTWPTPPPPPPGPPPGPPPQHAPPSFSPISPPPAPPSGSAPETPSGGYPG
jgi:hypothetical protein